MASSALVICRSEKPISSSGTAMAGGGGDVDSLLLGSDRAADKDGPHFYVKTLKLHLKHYTHMNTHEHMHKY